MPSTVRPGVEKDVFLDGERPSQVSAGPAAPAQPRDGWGPGKTSRTPRDLVGNGSESSPLAHRLRSWVSLTSKQKAGTEHRVLWGGARRKPQIQEEVELGGKHLHVISRQNISTCLHTTAILGLRRSVIAQRGTCSPKRASGSFKVTQPRSTYTGLLALCQERGEPLSPLLPLPLSF